jgi:hypothetical protein
MLLALTAAALAAVRIWLTPKLAKWLRDRGPKTTGMGGDE